MERKISPSIHIKTSPPWQVVPKNTNVSQAEKYKIYHKKVKHHIPYLLEKCASLLANTKNNTQKNEFCQTKKCHTNLEICDINEYITPHIDTSIHKI